MVQGLVNSFGPVVMAAFAAAVKIDSFAYMPVQDFGNAFSTFVAQNYGAGKQERIREGARKSVLLVLGFCLVISASVFVFAKQLLLILSSHTRQKFWQLEFNTCGLKVCFILELDSCFCFMDITGRSENRECRLC